LREFSDEKQDDNGQQHSRSTVSRSLALHSLKGGTAVQRPQSGVGPSHSSDEKSAEYRQNEARSQPCDRMDPEIKTVNKTVDIGVHFEDDLPDISSGRITRRRRCRVVGELAFLELFSVVGLHDGDVDGVWYADDDAGDEDEYDGKFRSTLIAPHNAYLRKPAAISQSINQSINQFIRRQRTTRDNKMEIIKCTSLFIRNIHTGHRFSSVFANVTKRAPAEQLNYVCW